MASFSTILWSLKTRQFVILMTLAVFSGSGVLGSGEEGAEIKLWS